MNTAAIAWAISFVCFALGVVDAIMSGHLGASLGLMALAAIMIGLSISEYTRTGYFLLSTEERFHVLNFGSEFPSLMFRGSRQDARARASRLVDQMGIKDGWGMESFWNSKDARAARDEASESYFRGIDARISEVDEMPVGKISLG